MKCPNVECSSNQAESKSGNNEIIFLRYDNDNMENIFIYATIIISHGKIIKLILI